MKSKLQRLCTALLIIALLLANMCIVSLAEDAIEISLKPVAASGTNVKIEGTLSTSEDRSVTIFVVPETIGDYTIDSLESFLEADRDGLVMESFVYASEKLSTNGNFEFAFTVPNTGGYVALVNSEKVSNVALIAFHVIGFNDYLNGLVGNYEAFAEALKGGFESIGCTLCDKYSLFTETYKNVVIQALFEKLEFEDMADLREKADVEIRGALDAILSDIVANSTDAQYAIGLMREMPTLFGVNKLSAYDHNLNDSGREYADAELCTKIADCNTLEELGDFFDTAVDNQLAQMESDIVTSFNSVSQSADFATLLKNNIELIGLTDSELKLMDRLSSAMHIKISASMMAASDNNNDGKSNFESFAEIAAAFKTAVNSEGNSALALDMINNRNNASEIVEILKEHEQLLGGLDLSGFEALGDSDDNFYRMHVTDEFLKGGPDASLTAVVQRFNSLVAGAHELKSLLDKINSADYSVMKEVLSDDNISLLNLSSETKSNYSYVKKNSSSEYTNLINNLVKYIPYRSLEDFETRVTSAVKSAKNKIEKGNSNNIYTGSSGGGGREYMVQGGTSEGVGNVVPEIIFTDIDSVPWAKTQILELAKMNIISGVGNKLFVPDRPVTREEFVKILVDAFGIYDENATCDFADVSKDSWYYGYVASGYQFGIVQGDGAGGFGVGQYITREDMAVLAYRVYVKINGNIEYADEEAPFNDSASIAPYAVDAVRALKYAGYISGTGNGLFSPKNTCTRAEAAVIIFNMIS